MLIVLSFYEDTGAPLSRAARERVWATFLARGTTHSSRAQTLGYIMRRCERSKTPYRLLAQPGVGYRIEPLGKDEEE